MRTPATTTRHFLSVGDYPVLASTGRPLSTPWDVAQSITPIGMGIFSVSTAGHGGIFVPNYLLPAIPANHRAWAKSWSGSENWYEEDCCWCVVALTFPELFSEKNQVAARRTAEGCVKDGDITWGD